MQEKNTSKDKKKGRTKRNTIIISVGITLIAITVIPLLILLALNHYTLELTVADGQTIHVEYGNEQGLSDVMAVYKGSIFNRKGTSVPVSMVGTVDYNTLGSYDITYQADYKQEQAIAALTVVVEDTTPPTIELVSNPEHITSPVGTYEEEGYTATDNYDGDITANVQRTEANGIVTYTVTDSSGNSATVERKIVYKDVVAPTITLTGGSDVTVVLGATVDLGCQAIDDCDGDITDKVVMNGTVDTSKEGDYTVVYQVADSAGNQAETTRIVHVYGEKLEPEEIYPGNKVVYLTFDDGPGVHTERLLNILDKYNAKATFFVTNQYPGYQNMIGESHRRGHTIALHTYSHDYAIYRSEETYYQDLKAIEDICIAQTGVKPSIVRFPGGTSNTISRNHCNGIMTTLSQSLPYHGYVYCDWNVSSGDAGGTTSAAGVAANVIAGIQGQDVSIVLQHDIKGYSVDAVEQILQWGQANGYTFLPMTVNTPMVHQRVNN